MACLTKSGAETTKGAAAFSLMLIDLDHFKAINDRHGHAAGDAALQHTANVIRNLLGKNDVFARFGGDEFALLLPQAGPVKAAKVAEKILKALTIAPLDWKGVIVPITASIGIEVVQAACKAETVLEAADKALYQTKRRGRNGYTLFQHAQRSRPVMVDPIDSGIGSKRTEEQDSVRRLA